MNNLYLAVNPDGTEICTNVQPERYLIGLNRFIEYAPNDSYANGLRMYLSRDDHWCDSTSEGHYCIPKFRGVVLPKGSIEKLIGRVMTWDDEPIKVDLSYDHQIVMD